MKANLSRVPHESVLCVCLPVCMRVCECNTHTHAHTSNICAVALLPSGQTRRAGVGGAGGSGGVQHASGSLRAAPTPGPRQPIRGQRRRAGVVQPGDRRPADARAQRRHPHLPPLVRPHYITLLPPESLPSWRRLGLVFHRNRFGKRSQPIREQPRTGNKPHGGARNTCLKQENRKRRSRVSVDYGNVRTRQE